MPSFTDFFRKVTLGYRNADNLSFILTEAFHHASHNVLDLATGEGCRQLDHMLLCKVEQH